MNDKSGPGEVEIVAWARLLKASAKMLDAVERDLKQAGLPPLAWYDALLELHRARPDGLRPGDLEKEVLLPQYNVSRLVDRLEAECDAANAELEPLKSFVLPGGTELAARLFVARAVCRSAERAVLRVDEASPLVAVYLNRLSDLLFILARAANAPADEILWKPGESPQP